MRRRPCIAGLCLLVTACGQSSEPLPKGEAIACGLGGAVELSAQCSLDRAVVDGAQLLVVRHPDGGFRRLIESADGQNLVAADGAEQSQSARKGERWEVILGDSRYVIPVRANAPKL